MCVQFLKLSARDSSEAARNASLCRNCLKGGHSSIGSIQWIKKYSFSLAIKINLNKKILLPLGLKPWRILIWALGKPDLKKPYRLYKRFGGEQTVVICLNKADVQSVPRGKVHVFSKSFKDFYPFLLCPDCTFKGQRRNHRFVSVLFEVSDITQH